MKTVFHEILRQKNPSEILESSKKINARFKSGNSSKIAFSKNVKN